MDNWRPAHILVRLGILALVGPRLARSGLDTHARLVEFLQRVVRGAGLGAEIVLEKVVDELLLLGDRPDVPLLPRTRAGAVTVR